MTSNTPKSLVLIVGAGGSKEVDLPLGSELKNSIAKALDIRYEHGFRRISGDGMIDDAFRILARERPAPDTNDINLYLYAARRIAGAMPQAISIDNFIDSHRGNEAIALCGKLAIVRSIVEAEKKSKLYVDPKNSHNKLRFADVENTWFNAFFQLLTENCDWSELPGRLAKVAIVTFNYDRCIEHYLYHGLQNYYGVSAGEAAQVLESLAIYHPYGTVGKLDWQSQSNGIAYGGDLHAHNLLHFADGIRTFTEGIDPKLGESDAIRNVLAQAQRMAFLGFAFHRLNMDLLFKGPPSAANARACPIYATSMGLSVDEIRRIEGEVAELANIQRGPHLNFDNRTCYQMLCDYRRSLSLT